MTKELQDFLKNNRKLLQDNINISKVLTICPPSLKGELLEILENQQVQIPSLIYSIQPLDEAQWVASWSFGIKGAFSVDSISVVQLKELGDEGQPFSVVLQGHTGSSKVIKYIGKYYLYQELIESPEFILLEKERKAYTQKALAEKTKAVTNNLKSLSKILKNELPELKVSIETWREEKSCMVRSPHSYTTLIEVTSQNKADPNTLYDLIYKSSGNTRVRKVDLSWNDVLQEIPQVIESVKDFIENEDQT